MKITEKQLLRIIREETMQVLAELSPVGTDARNFQVRPGKCRDDPAGKLCAEEIRLMSDKDLLWQFEEVCRGDTLDNYCRTVRAQQDSRKEDIMSNKYIETA